MDDLRAKSLKEWQDARFGMFIHWGAYSVGGLDCWKMHDMGIPVKEYAKRFTWQFNPKKFNAKAFADTAKSAGCKYVVMGSRHHEGFCLWNTKTTKYSTMNFTPKRDFIKEYVEAIRGAGLKVGFYYSMLDWRYKGYWDGPRKNPDGWKKLVDLVHAQVRELMTNYGKMDILWYDGGWMIHFARDLSEAEVAEAWRTKELNDMVHELQPHILINNRSYDMTLGDFGTPEQSITAEQRPWELCDTLGQLWGYAPQDRIHKTPREVVVNLINCVAGGGNMLLNIGPKPDGSVQDWQAKMMKEIGRWMKKHGESIYGCGAETGAPLNYGLAPWRTTKKDNILYVHLFRYPGSEFSIANLHGYYFEKATLLTTGKPLKIIHEPTRDIFRGLPEKSPDPISAVVKIVTRPATEEEKRSREVIGLDDPEDDSLYF